MLTFWGSRFQYFLSVSPQEGLGRVDLRCWILEAQKRWFSCRFGCSRGHLEGFSAVAQGLSTVPRSRPRATAGGESGVLDGREGWQTSMRTAAMRLLADAQPIDMVGKTRPQAGYWRSAACGRLDHAMCRLALTRSIAALNGKRQHQLANASSAWRPCYHRRRHFGDV